MGVIPTPRVQTLAAWSEAMKDKPASPKMKRAKSTPRRERAMIDTIPSSSVTLPPLATPYYSPDFPLYYCDNRHNLSSPEMQELSKRLEDARESKWRIRQRVCPFNVSVSQLRGGC